MRKTEAQPSISKLCLVHYASTLVPMPWAEKLLGYPGLPVLPIDDVSAAKRSLGVGGSYLYGFVAYESHAGQMLVPLVEKQL